MAGHLFVVHGDLRTLHCDHWLLPVDRGLGASRSWNRHPAWLALRDGLPRSMPEGSRVLEVPWTGSGRPWLTNVAGGRNAPPEWQADGVAQFLELAAAAPPTLTRERPILALPVVGTGFGGKRHFSGEVLQAVVPRIYRCLEDLDVDVAMVTWTEEDFAAAQAARRACEVDGQDLWPDLDAGLVARARHLAHLASRQRLVVFLGAGISAGAGLPAWGQLLGQLARTAGLSADEQIGLSALGFLDQAQIVARRLGSDPDALGRAVSDALNVGDTVALSHMLLAGLPVREFITTNYDDCFERAAAAVDRPVARLPYAPASGAGRWLLKMHGCVSAPEDIVLTRQDYVRYAERSAALAGIVQAMLITRHMLFVGFSLDDDNFHRIVDAVRRALVGGSHVGLGSVVSLFANPLLEQLWGDDLQWIHLTDGNGPRSVPAAARRFEVFLDCLSSAAAAPHHLMNPRFQAILSPGEQSLAEALAPLRQWKAKHRSPDPDDPVAAAWARVAALLWDLGDRG